jgi:hypothetical protein
MKTLRIWALVAVTVVVWAGNIVYDIFVFKLMGSWLLHDTMVELGLNRLQTIACISIAINAVMLMQLPFYGLLVFLVVNLLKRDHIYQSFIKPQSEKIGG